MRSRARSGGGSRCLPVSDFRTKAGADEEAPAFILFSGQILPDCGSEADRIRNNIAGAAKLLQKCRKQNNSAE